MTAPLFTIQTSMQLSIAPNAVTIERFKKTNDMSRSFQARMGHLGGQSADSANPLQANKSPGIFDAFKKSGNSAKGGEGA